MYYNNNVGTFDVCPITIFTAIIAVVPKYSPKEAYIAALEEICTSLPQNRAIELRDKTSHMLKKNCPPPKPKISQEETKAIKELREESFRVILTVDKG